MGIYLTKEKKADIFQTHGGSATNSGSIEGQAALFTFRVQELSKHLQKRSLLQKNSFGAGWKKKAIASLFGTKRYHEVSGTY